MSHYAFRCLRCEETFAVEQSLLEYRQGRKVKCPKCKRKKKTIRLFLCLRSPANPSEQA